MVKTAKGLYLRKGFDYSIFTYSLSGESKTRQVRFVYALKGRDSEEGLVSYYKGKFLAPACFVVPEESARHIMDIFSAWKIKCRRLRVCMRDSLLIN